MDVGRGRGELMFLTTAQLAAGLAEVRRSPTDGGVLDLIVRRPAIGEREVLEVGELSTVAGLVGDTWEDRPSSRTGNGTAHPDMQLTIINARAIALISPDPHRRQLAGDQLHIDLDLSHENLPAGTQIAIGSAIVEVTDQPHTGCKKFAARFGTDAWRFVNATDGAALRMRGINARVVRSGIITRGETVTKL